MSLQGDITTLVPMPDPNGIAIGLDGFAYAASSRGVIWRIDPATGDYTVLHEDTGRSFDGITLSKKADALYFNGEEGGAHKMMLRADGTADTPAEIANFGGSGGGGLGGGDFGDLLDGMTVDECDNLYVVQMGGKVFRIDPDGGTEEAVNVGDGGFGITAANFGSGAGGWKTHSLYVMSLAGTVYEVDLGVGGKAEPHLSR